jgi:hypothetical protein
MNPSSISDQEILAVIDDCLEELRACVQIGMARRGITNYSVVVQMRLAVCSVVNDPDGAITEILPAIFPEHIPDGQWWFDMWQGCYVAAQQLFSAEVADLERIRRVWRAIGRAEDELYDRFAMPPEERSAAGI